MSLVFWDAGFQLSDVFIRRPVEFYETVFLLV